MLKAYLFSLSLPFSKIEQVLDVGCGVGGPLREIALFSGSQVTGLNNNDYQIKKGTEYNRKVCGMCRVGQNRMYTPYTYVRVYTDV